MTWFCYLLVSINESYLNHSYIGITTDLKRRLRQHNGELSGGAKNTRAKRPYKILSYVSGFETKGDALKCEIKIKKSKQYLNRKKAMKSFVKTNDNYFYSKNLEDLEI